MDKIETLDDWNARLACCCAIPACPVPEVVAESFSSTISLWGCGFMEDDLKKPEGYSVPCNQKYWIYRKKVTTITAVKSGTEGSGTYSKTETETCNSETCGTESKISETRQGDSDLGGPIWAYEGSVTESRTTGFYEHVIIYKRNVDIVHIQRIDTTAVKLSDLLGNPMDELLSKFNKQFKDDGYSDGIPSSRLTIYDETCNGKPVNYPLAMFGRKSRYRWKIPTSHEGTFFKITWDVLFFPDDVNLKPSFIEHDKTWKWSGPGNKDDHEGESWKGPWNEIPVPVKSGECRIVNIRFECYGKTPYGNKPQITGEGYEP